MLTEKTSQPVAARHQSTGAAFFRKATEDHFFSNQEPPSFFNAIQPKLTVSQPDDPQEREADAVADQVMRMPEPGANPGTMPQDATALPSGAPADEDPIELQRKEEEGGEMSVQPAIIRNGEPPMHH